MTTAAYIASINVSPGGVPKLPVPEALVTTSGLFGDSQKNRKYHGGPLRAVSLFSLERIRALQEEGHPIGIGTTGENITVAGIDWNHVSPGVVLELGQARVEVTGFTIPCFKIKESFIGHRFSRMSERHHPGWSRVYAKVLIEGLVRPGDPVQVRGSEGIIRSDPDRSGFRTPERLPLYSGKTFE